MILIYYKNGIYSSSSRLKFNNLQKKNFNLKLIGKSTSPNYPKQFKYDSSFWEHLTIVKSYIGLKICINAQGKNVRLLNVRKYYSHPPVFFLL